MLFYVSSKLFQSGASLYNAVLPCTTTPHSQKCLFYLKHYFWGCTTLYYIVQILEKSNMLFYVSWTPFQFVQRCTTLCKYSPPPEKSFEPKNIIFEIVQRCTSLYNAGNGQNVLLYVSWLSSKLFNLFQARKNILFEIVQRRAMLYNARNCQTCYFMSPQNFKIWYKLVQRCTIVYKYSALPENVCLFYLKHYFWGCTTLNYS